MQIHELAYSVAAPHPSLGEHIAERPNSNGKALLQILEGTDLCIVNTFEATAPTFYSSDGKSCSYIDFVLAPSD